MYETTEDLRNSIMQDLVDLRAGKINNAQARTRAIVVRAVIDTISVEIAAAQLGRSFEPVRISKGKVITITGKTRRLKSA